jgi:hypothetical protein
LSAALLLLSQRRLLAELRLLETGARIEMYLSASQ